MIISFTTNVAILVVLVVGALISAYPSDQLSDVEELPKEFHETESQEEGLPPRPSNDAEIFDNEYAIIAADLRYINSIGNIEKIFIKSMNDCPNNKRRLTLEEATKVKSKLLPLMGTWDIIKLAGGKIDGSGYGNVITPGEFDKGFGWVFLVDAGFRSHKIVFIKSLNEIPCGYRRATVEECRSGPQADAVRANRNKWDIIKVAGGRFTGPGYGSTLEQGFFDGGVGWVALVTECI